LGMKVAIGGKGGVGKTTVCSVWAQLFAAEGHDVLAIDADPSLSLGAAFGLPPAARPKPLIEMKDLIAERTGARKDGVGAYFRLNPAVHDLPEEHWLKVANGLPSVEGWSRGGSSPVGTPAGVGDSSVKLLVLGAVTRAGGGCACPEGAFLKALLTHTILQRDELVLVDLAAGVEFLGRASVQGIDAFVVVVEPGSRSIETAGNIAAMARELGIGAVGAIANKVTEPAQLDVIREQLKGVDLLGSVAYSKSIQEADLKRAPVVQADAAVVRALDEARRRLVGLTMRVKI
jgi:CO dehydrogenase maturation factor